MHGTLDAETLTLFSSLYSQACEAAYGHDKYSGSVLHLADEGGVLLLALVGEVPWCGSYEGEACGCREETDLQERTVSVFYGPWE